MKVALTVFADASYHRRHGTAGWGCWIMGESPGRAFAAGGQIRELLVSSSEAEVRALANALALVKQLDYAGEGDAVLFQSDSVNALGWILRALPTASDSPAPGGLRVPRPRIARPAFRASRGAPVFAELSAELGIQVLVRHVRAHTGLSEPNDICDRIAKHHQAERLKRHKMEIADGRHEDARPIPACVA